MTTNNRIYVTSFLISIEVKKTARDSAGIARKLSLELGYMSLLKQGAF